MSLKKMGLMVLITAFMSMAVFCISCILFDSWNETTVSIMKSILIIFLFSIPGFICSSCYENSKNKLVAMFGLIICILACVHSLFLTWEIINISYSDELLYGLNEKLFSTEIMLVFFLSHISILLSGKSEDKLVECCQYGTIGFMIVFYWLIFSQLVLELEMFDSSNRKFFAILVILILLGTLITPLVKRLKNKTVSENEVKVAKEDDDKYKKIEQLKKLLDDSAITQEEYDSEKKKILNS